MKAQLWIMLTLFFVVGCEPEMEDPFRLYKIPKGTHSGIDPIQLLQSNVLSFRAIFDHTAVYTSRQEENQWDTNKLAGFSDCNSFHHEHSARFGWRWLNGQLEILAYCYVSGVRMIEKIGVVPLDEPSRYQILLTDDAYVFQLNDLPPVRIARAKPCKVGAYYMLWPYFGGDEKAPHDIHIYIAMDTFP